jgi:extracellular elastinolytic metalloproteinase
LQTFGGGVDHPLARRDGSLADAASAFIQNQLKVDLSSVKFKSGYSSDIVQYAYIKQQHVGIRITSSSAS